MKVLIEVDLDRLIEINLHHEGLSKITILEGIMIRGGTWHRIIVGESIWIPYHAMRKIIFKEEE